MDDLGTAYDAQDAETGPDVSRVERALLCDLLDRLGPSAPTLCEGWDTHHLAAHLSGREGSPLRSALSALPKLGDRLVDYLAQHRDYGDLVDEVRSGPSRLSVFSLPRLEPLLNVVELFVHHEDVRRASAGWQARALPSWAQDQIWARVVGFAKLSLRRAPTALVLERSDTAQRASVSTGDVEVTVHGPPSEIALWVTGRRSATLVELTGEPAAVAAYTDTSHDA